MPPSSILVGSFEPTPNPKPKTQNIGREHLWRAHHGKSCERWSVSEQWNATDCENDQNLDYSPPIFMIYRKSAVVQTVSDGLWEARNGEMRRGRILKQFQTACRQPGNQIRPLCGILSRGGSTINLFNSWKSWRLVLGEFESHKGQRFKLRGWAKSLLSRDSA